MDSHNLDYPLRLIPQSKNGPTSQDPVNGYGGTAVQTMEINMPL